MEKYTQFKGLDELNESILKELQRDARLSITEIGKRVGLSGPAVSDRIRKMEDDGFHHLIGNFRQTRPALKAEVEK